MSFIKYRQFGNKEYAYELTSYRDPQTKKVKHRSKYLGVVVDKEKHTFERRLFKHRTEKLILDFGDSYIVQKILENTGFFSLLREIFGKETHTIFSLITYRLCYNAAMMYVERWYEGSYASIQYKEARISSQRISEFLTLLNDEQLQRMFLKEYITRFINVNNGGVVIDATSIPNQIHNPLTAWGRNGEEIDEQIRFLLALDKNTSLPFFFRVLPGNIVDVSTLKNTTIELKKYGLTNMFVYIDAGYFSEENILDMYKEEINFITRLPSNRTLYKNLMEKEVADLEKKKYAVRYGKRGMFVKEKVVNLFGKMAFAYIVLDPKRKGREVDKLILDSTEKDTHYDEIELNYGFMTRGIMVVVSSFQMKTDEVVPTYYMRQEVEMLFGFSKDDLALYPLRVHSEDRIHGFLFLQFITLIAFIQLKKKIGNKYTVEEILLTMRNLKCKVFDNELIISELTKDQKDLCEDMDVVVPKTSGI